MAFSLFSKKKDLLALDLGTSSIKYVLLEERGKKYNVKKAGKIAVETDLSGAKDDLESVKKSLALLVEQEGLIKKKLNNIIFSLPASLAIIRHIQMPAMPEDRLKNMIRFEAEQHIPFPIDDVALGYEILHKDEKNIELLITAIKKDKVDEYVSIITSTGLNPEIIDISAFSLFNYYDFSEGGLDKSKIITKEDSSEKTASKEEGSEEAAPEKQAPEESSSQVLLDIGASTTDIILIENGKVYFTRSIPISGNSLTDAVGKALQLEKDEAEKLKIKYGSARLESLTSAAKPAASPKTGLYGGGLGMPKSPLGGLKPKPGIGAPKPPAEGEGAGAPPPPSKPDGLSVPPKPKIGLGMPKAPSGDEGAGAPPPPSKPDGLSVPPKPKIGLGMPKPPAGDEGAGTPPPPSKPDGLSVPPKPKIGLGMPKPPAGAESSSETKSELPSSEPRISSSMLKGKIDGGTSVAKPGGLMTSKKVSSDAPPPPPMMQKKMMGQGIKPGQPPKPGLLINKPVSEKKDDNSDSGGNSLGAAKADGVEFDQNALNSPEDEEMKNKVEGALKPLLDRMVAELKRSFDYHKNQLGGSTPHKIVIFSGGSGIKKLDKFLSDRLQIEAEVFDVKKAVDVPESIDLTPDFAGALGLALRSRRDCAININLLPADIAVRKRELSKKRNLIAMGVLASLFLIILTASGWFEYSNKKTELNNIEEKLVLLKEVTDKVNDLRRVKENLEARKNLIINLTENKARWLDVLLELYDLITIEGDIWLHRLNFPTKNNMTLSVRTISFEKVGSMYRRLNDSPYFEVYEHPNATQDMGIYSFDLTVRVNQFPDEIREQKEAERQRLIEESASQELEETEKETESEETEKETELEGN